MPLDGLDHGWSEDLGFEIGIDIGNSGTYNRSKGENNESYEAEHSISSEYGGIVVVIVIKDCRRARPMGGIDGIVGARKQLVEIAGKMGRTFIFTEYRQIGCDLPVKQAQFLEFGTGERAEALARAMVEKFFQVAPMRISFF
jgi:hypothetical protein